MVALVGIALTVIVWLAARRVDGLPRWVRTVALATALGTIAQIPLGGITVLLDLHPVAVMSHFLLALVVLAGCGRRGARGVEPSQRARARRPGRAGCARSRPSASPPAPCSSSPARSRRRPGRTPAEQDIPRLGLGVTDTVYVHVRATAVFGIGLLVVGLFLWRLRRELPGIARAGVVLLGVLLVQMAVGEIQYRNALPWWLVVIHVALAATIWALTVAIAYSLYRPPAPLVSGQTRTAKLRQWRTSSGSTSGRRCAARS